MTVTKTTNIQQKLCLATVSNKEYWSGTSTMIKSFLKHNRWFNGDVIIISDDNSLQNRFIKGARIKYVQPSKRLKQSIKNLCLTYPFIAPVKSRLFVLELFNLSGKSNILYADSDILFTDSVEAITTSERIAAVRDPWYFRGYSRKRKTYEKIPLPSGNNVDCFERFYNSGILCIDNSLISKSTYDELLAKIVPETYQLIKDILADEPVLNVQFEHEFVELDASFNSPVHLIIDKTLKTTPVVIHFTGNYKPWKLISWISLNLRSVKYSKYLLKWLKIHWLG